MLKTTIYNEVVYISTLLITSIICANQIGLPLFSGVFGSWLAGLYRLIFSNNSKDYVILPCFVLLPTMIFGNYFAISNGLNTSELIASIMVSIYACITLLSTILPSLLKYFARIPVEIIVGILFGISAHIIMLAFSEAFGLIVPLLTDTTPIELTGISIIDFVIFTLSGIINYKGTPSILASTLFTFNVFVLLWQRQKYHFMHFLTSLRLPLLCIFNILFVYFTHFSFSSFSESTIIDNTSITSGSYLFRLPVLNEYFPRNNLSLTDQAYSGTIIRFTFPHFPVSNVFAFTHLLLITFLLLAMDNTIRQRYKQRYKHYYQKNYFPLSSFNRFDIPNTPSNENIHVNINTNTNANANTDFRKNKRVIAYINLIGAFFSPQPLYSYTFKILFKFETNLTRQSGYYSSFGSALSENNDDNDDINDYDNDNNNNLMMKCKPLAIGVFVVRGFFMVYLAPKFICNDSMLGQLPMCFFSAILWCIAHDIINSGLQLYYHKEAGLLKLLHEWDEVSEFETQKCRLSLIFITTIFTFILGPLFGTLLAVIISVLFYSWRCHGRQEIEDRKEPVFISYNQSHTLIDVYLENSPIIHQPLSITSPNNNQ